MNLEAAKTKAIRWIQRDDAYGSDVTESLVLLDSGRDGDVEEQNPRDADFLPHLVQRTKNQAKRNAGEWIGLPERYVLRKGSNKVRNLTLMSTLPRRGLRGARCDQQEQQDEATVSHPPTFDLTHSVLIFMNRPSSTYLH